MSELPPKLAEILENLALFPEREERIQMLIALAEGFHSVPESVASRPFAEEHRVQGCESEAFVWAVPTGNGGGALDFYFAVENPQGISAMAMARILQDAASGAPLAQVVAIPPDVIYQIFGRELSMGKSMGLMGMVERVRAEAKRALGTPSA